MLGRIPIYLILALAVISVFIFRSHTFYTASEENSVISISSNIDHLTTSIWGIFDSVTGELLEGENEDVVRPIASITKLYTAYAALQSEYLDTDIGIIWTDLYTPGEAGRLSHGDRFTIRELLFPLLIESSNDAGEAIRRTLGSSFNIYIDTYIDAHGLTETVIVDGSGLSTENVSTVRDLARLYSSLRSEVPYITDITQLKLYAGTDSGWINNNPARAHKEFVGGKHGYTDEVGRTLVASFLLPSGREIGIVLLGSSDLDADITTLLDYIKERY